MKKPLCVIKINNEQIKYSFISILGIAFFVLSWIQLELSSTYESWKEIFQMDGKYIWVNLSTLFIIWLLVYLIVHSLWKTCAIFSTITSVIAIVNYYTIKFHGMPLAVSELKNFRTALNVIGAYNFDIKEILNLLWIFFLEVIVCFILRCSSMNRAEEKQTLKVKLVKDVCIGCLCGFVFYFIYLSSSPVMTESLGWSWKETYHMHGYAASTVSRAVASLDFLDQPEGYLREHISEIRVEEQANYIIREEYPDIILILNESFYDLSLITDLKTDTPYLDNISTMDNAIRGYAVVPSVGGGTNNSEYELLTSNSLKLMQGIVPFNVIDMNGANSIVSHLKQLGYYTIGAHSEPALNYNRGNAYRNMGFDTTYFDDEFTDKEYYGDRYYETDTCLYKNLLTWLNENNDFPLFTYLLTIQNHGGWDMNDEKLDIVHTMNDFGEYTGQVNEYLTCVYLSDTAFKTLTDQLNKLDKDIIVCMVGDHCPAFAESIVDEAHKAKSSFLLKQVPFIIWANYEIEEQDEKIISLNYLAPILMEAAGVKLSPYYQYMLDLKSSVPILTSTQGVYYDSFMEEYPYDSVSDYTEQVNDYFYLEYNNLQKDRDQSMFKAY